MSLAAAESPTCSRIRGALDCAQLIAALVLAEGIIFCGRCIEAVRGPFKVSPGWKPVCSKPFCYAAGQHEVDRWFGRGWVCSKHKRG